MASSSLTSTQAEKALIDQIVSEFFAKSLHIILDSRIPYLSMQNHAENTSHHSAASVASTTASPSSTKAGNRWFNIEMDNCASVIDSVEPWRRGSPEPMVVDILLQQPMGGDIPSPSGAGGQRYFKGTSPSRGNSSGESWSGEGEGEGCVSPGGLSRTILERWAVQYVPRKKVGAQGSSKLVIGFGEGASGAGGGASTGSKGALKGSGGGGGPPLPYPSSHVVERPVVYKRTVIMLRSLYCTMRTLPAHRLFRLVNSSSHSRSFSLSYRVSSSPPPLSESDEAAMMTCILTPVETMWGRLCISVAYRHTTAVTALEITPPILPRIIQDYVGSPTTDPLRRFSNVGSLPGAVSSRRGVHVISLPSSVPSSPSGPSFGRRHSWSGGVQKFPPALTATPSFRASRSPSPSQPPDFNPSPPLLPSPYSSSPSTNLPSGLSPRTSPNRPSFPRPHTAHPVGHHVGRDNLSQPIPIHDRGRSPSFSPSPSPSPPTPSHFAPQQEGAFSHVRSAPVSIPRPSSARPNLGTSPKRLMLTEGPPQQLQQAQLRSQYPPPSPSRNVDGLPRVITGNTRLWTGPQIPNLFVPSLDGRVAAPCLSISTLAESSLLVSPPHPYHQAGEERGEDGPPSGVKRSLYAPPRLITLGSRSPKIGSQDDADEEEFSCPFAVDDDEAEDYRSRMESPRVRLTSDAFEQAHQRSQDAAVGALVRILKAAPPLRHWSPASPANSGSPSPRHSLPPSIGSHVGSTGSGRLKNSPPLPTTRCRSGSTSLVGSPSSQMHVGGKLSPKTSRSALEELRGYVEMRDHLLRQSGGKFQSSSPGKHM